MRNRKGTRGAISVFLAMILVPCIVISSVFVDLSRVHLSKAVAESSADLALNSLLTNYDADLKDWYGMVASCQNIEEFYQTSAEFFIRALKSQGMSESEIILLSDYYANATSDDTIYDLLKVESKTEPSAMITEVKGANLSNATLVKDQIVEFMKYRAPIEITVNLVDRFKNDGSVSQAIEAEKNEPLVESKQEFYETEGELLEAAFSSYKAIKKYWNAGKDFKNESLEAVYSNLETYKQIYKDITIASIKHLCNTDKLKDDKNQPKKPTVNLDAYHSQYSDPKKEFSKVYSDKETVDGTEVYTITIDKVKILVDDLSKATGDFETAKTNFESAAQSAMNLLPIGNEDSQSNAVQWLLKMNGAVNASSGTNHIKTVKEAAQNMLKAYSKVLAIDKCTITGDLPDKWKSLSEWKDKLSADNLLSKVETYQSTYLTSGAKSDSDKYLKAINTLVSTYTSNKQYLESTGNYVTIDGKGKTLDEAITYVSTGLTETRKKLQGFVDKLDVAINGDDDTSSLDDLKKLAGEYNTDLQTWSGNANSRSNNATDEASMNMGAKDQVEIADIKEHKITTTAVTTLKTRLTNMRAQYQDAIDAIDSLKWGNKKIIDINAYSTYKSQLNSKVDKNSIKVKNSELKSYANTVFGNLFAPSSMPSMKHKNDTTYNLQINPSTKEVDTPDLWEYLYDTYNGKEGAVEEAKSEKDSAKNTGTAKAEKAKDRKYNGGGSDISRDFSSDKSVGIDDALVGMIDFVTKLLSGDLTSMRDDLYATVYIMEMFSHTAYSNEGHYKLLKLKDPEAVTKLKLKKSDTNPDYYVNAYKTVEGTAESTESEEKNDENIMTWLSTNPKNNYNKSLTNKMLNKKNNKAYLAEIEYILKGKQAEKNKKGETEKSGNEANISAVFGDIYAVRYGLNLVSGFQHFWSGDNATADVIGGAALAVQTATQQIIPAPVTKAVLIPILTIFETSKDLDRLEAGFPVEIYKTGHEQWWCAISGGVSEKDENGNGGIGQFMNKLTSGDFDRANPDEGFFYSDYLTAFVYLGLSNTDTADAMYQRTAEVIQANMGKLSGDTKYSLKKSRVYFQLKTDLEVSPLMITMPIFNNEDYTNHMDTKKDWCTYSINTVRGYS